MKNTFVLMAQERQWPIAPATRGRLAARHEPEASSSPDGFRLATCVMPTCLRPMVAMWHLWVDSHGIKKEIHMCHACATDIFGAPTPDVVQATEDAPSIMRSDRLA